MELPSYYPSGIYTSEVAVRVLENVCTPDTQYILSLCITGKCAVRRATFDTFSPLWATKCFVFMLMLFIFSRPLTNFSFVNGRFSRKSNLTTVVDL